MAVSVPKRLADLTDVTIVSPADGQVLAYDEGTGTFGPVAPSGAGAKGDKGDTGAQGPPGSGTAWYDVTEHGVTRGVDCTAALQALFDATSGPITLFFPEGDYLYSDPVYIDRPYCTVRGAGMWSTTVTSVNGKTPFLVFGLRRTETVGGTPQVVSSLHRPDMHGVLDSSIAPGANNWLGFATRGGTAQSCYGMAVDGPMVYGKISPTLGGRVFEGYGETTGWCLQVAIVVANGLSDLGTGSFSINGLKGSSNPGPFWFGLDAGGNWYGAITTSDGVVRSHRATPSSTGPGLHRLRWHGDFTGGTYGIVQNSNALTPISNSTMAGLAGKRFMPSDGTGPFWFGPSTGTTSGTTATAVPSYTIAAASWTVHDVAAEPADDAHRYAVQSDEPDKLWAFDGTQLALSRTLQFAVSVNLTSTRKHQGFIIPCAGTDGGIKGNAATDMTVAGGGIVVGQLLNFYARRLNAVDGFTGLRTLPFQVVYPIDLVDCRFGGWVYALFVNNATPLRMTNVDIQSCGPIAAVHCLGCNVAWRGGFGEGFMATGSKWWLRLAADTTGGSYTLESLFPSSEAGFFTEACVSIEAVNAGVTVVRISDVQAGQVGATAALVEFTENAASYGGLADVFGLKWYDATGTSLAVRASAKWKGTADLRNNQIQRTSIAAPSGFTVLT